MHGRAAFVYSAPTVDEYVALAQVTAGPSRVINISTVKYRL